MKTTVNQTKDRIKEFSKAEKTIIESALYQYRKILTWNKEDLESYAKSDCKDFDTLIEQAHRLWVNVILDMHPIKKQSNNVCVRERCPLCGRTFKAGIPEWGFLDNNAVCDFCIKEHNPKLFKEISQSCYPEDMYPDEPQSEVKTVDELPF